MTNLAGDMLMLALRAAGNDESARAGLMKMSQDMRDAGENDGNITAALCAAMLDGTRYGNWPTPDTNWRNVALPVLHPLALITGAQL